MLILHLLIILLMAGSNKLQLSYNSIASHQRLLGTNRVQGPDQSDRPRRQRATGALRRVWLVRGLGALSNSIAARRPPSAPGA